MIAISASAWLFYTSNLVIVSGYLFAAVMITLRVSVAKDLSVRAWIAGLAFFVFCGMTHIELALHSFWGRQIIGDGGGVDWHMLAVHIPQAFSIWLFLLSVRASNVPPRPGPLFRLRTWWWEFGQPPHPGAPVPLEGVAGEAVHDSGD